ncbi:hypothetical protein [Phormidium tenue]|jgi:hypothetical protein|uniref:Uncharacterized protein n=1 Tax=Phormidium tenue FACHB-1050 TaxID=2692857 RepID=A0ABR8C8T5_9CYAN|nr:hypothetical protein [Phormidium tenue]MBD2316780.1 hypothetical protein [Phormidium tenue FACHB-1050]
MKKIFLSILASVISFAAISPVFAGTVPVQAGSQTSSSPILLNIPSSSQGNSLSININNTITSLLNASENNPNIRNIVVLLSNGNGDSTSVAAAQSALSNQFASLGLNVDSGSPASNLINALTGLVSGNFNGESGQSQSIDLSKLFLAIESFNQIVNGLTNTANGSDAVAAAQALEALKAMSTDATVTTLSTTLAAISKDLK